MLNVGPRAITQSATGFEEGERRGGHSAEAIDTARELEPGAAIHVERVRTTSKGKPDQWRKP